MEHTGEQGSAGQERRLGGLSPWHVLSIAIVVLGLVALVWLVLMQTPTANDAVNILAVIVPAFASFGAAIFGVQVAYGAGKDSGERVGTESGVKQGRQQGRKELAAALLQEIPQEPTKFQAKGTSGQDSAQRDEFRGMLLEVLREPMTG